MAMKLCMINTKHIYCPLFEDRDNSYFITNIKAPPPCYQNLSVLEFYSYLQLLLLPLILILTRLIVVVVVLIVVAVHKGLVVVDKILSDTH